MGLAGSVSGVVIGITAGTAIDVLSTISFLGLRNVEWAPMGAAIGGMFFGVVAFSLSFVRESQKITEEGLELKMTHKAPRRQEESQIEISVQQKTAAGTYLIAPPQPSEHEWERRLNRFAQQVALELKEASVPFSRPRTNFWVISYDIEEAWWCPAEENSWDYNHGRVRSGSANGTALVLFENGEFGAAEFHGEVDVLGEEVAFKTPGVPYWGSEWAAGNLGHWSSERNPHPRAQESFNGYWPRERTLPPGDGTSAELARFLTHRQSQQPPRY